MVEANELKQAETISAKGDRIVLYYFIVENTHTKAELGKTTYGIGVEMYTQLPNERSEKERKVINSVFVNKSEAEKFIDIICRGCVTPITLEDVIYDYISEEAI